MKRFFKSLTAMIIATAILTSSTFIGSVGYDTSQYPLGSSVIQTGSASQVTDSLQATESLQTDNQISPVNTASILDASSVPDAVGYDNAVSSSHVKRLYDAEGEDLNKVVFLNSDGTKTAYFFAYDVKYTDDNGDIQDISLNIESREDGAYRSTQTASITTFSKKLSDGIVLEGNGEKISLVPISSAVYSESLTVNGASSGTEPTVHKTDDKTVTYTIDTKTTINYSLTYTGFKEDIIVSEYTGQTEYDFVLNTNGLTLEEINGSFRLVDENSTVKATLGDIIIFTSDNANNTMGEMTARTVKANEKYILTVKVDDDYLKDAKTKYPITIDPTVEICYDNNGTGAISDVTLNSLDDCSPDSGALFVGLRQTYGISRILMKFPGLNLSSLGSNINITKATVEMRDLMCEDSDLTVYCHPFTGNAWTESTVDWTNVNPDSYGVYSSSKVISYTNGNALDPKYRYSFDITSIAKGWKNGTYDINKGIIFKASNFVETGSTYSSRTFASYNRATNKPSLSVTYENVLTVSAPAKHVMVGGTLQMSAATPFSGMSVTWPLRNNKCATISSTGLLTATAE